MAITQTNTVIHDNATLTASAADTTATAQDMSGTEGGSLFIKLTNGATGPTVPAQVQIQVSGDNSNFYNFGGALIGGTANNGVSQWGGIDIPKGNKYVRTVSGSNTGQNVTLRVEIVKVTR